uniref:Blood vessel epicardial substance n=1 Tax=Cacopsylla melanoneura TaxID=428564 RepID=A0A8D8Z0Q2_9HEMI
MKLLLMERKLRLGLLLVTIEDKNQKRLPASNKRSSVNIRIMENDTITSSSSLCPHWVSTQDQLFQYSHICFVIAFCAPRIYKPSILFFRLLLVVGLLISAFWSGVHVCFYDAFVWNMVLAVVNASHAGALISIFLPPALSIELTELYIRVFKPVKISKKQFKELTSEATLCKLAQGESYAIEERSSADERLSILLRGKMNVTCDNTHLHYVAPFQFVDSPEFVSNQNTSDELYQVSITAEEDCLYLCWSRISLDRLLRHRPMLKSVFNCLIGKDITQKLYALNELISNNAQNSAEPWRHKMNRSVSVDAVNTTSRGQVRSNDWRLQQSTSQQTSSQPSSSQQSSTKKHISQIHSPLRTSHQQCYVPIVANQFPALSPFTIVEEETPFDSIEECPEPAVTSKCGHSRTSSMKSTQHSTGDYSDRPSSSQVTLFPVMVPLLAAPTLPGVVTTKRQREVKFDETIL